MEVGGLRIHIRLEARSFERQFLLVDIEGYLLSLLVSSLDVSFVRYC